MSGPFEPEPESEPVVGRPMMPTARDLENAIGRLRARPPPINAAHRGHNRPSAGVLQAALRRMGLENQHLPYPEARPPPINAARRGRPSAGQLQAAIRRMGLENQHLPCPDAATTPRRMGLENQHLPYPDAATTPRPRRLTRRRENTVRQVLSAACQPKPIDNADSIGEPFTVKLTTLSGESTEWKVYPGEQVNEWRSRIAAHLEVTDSRIKLLNGPKAIKRHLTCELNQLEEGSNVTLVIVPPLYPGSEIFQKIFSFRETFEEDPDEMHEALNQDIVRRTKLNDAFACIVRRSGGIRG